MSLNKNNNLLSALAQLRLINSISAIANGMKIKKPMRMTVTVISKSRNQFVEDNNNYVISIHFLIWFH